MGFFDGLKKKKAKIQEPVQTAAETAIDSARTMETAQEEPGRMDCRAFLLCMQEDLDEIMNRIGRNFGMEDSGHGNTLELQNGDMKISLFTAAKSMGGEAEAFVKEQIDQMWASFMQVETEAVDGKINVLHQLRLSKSIVNIDYSFVEQEGADKKSMIEGMLASVLEELQGIMLITGEPDGLYCLDENGEIALILSGDGRSEVRDFMPLETPCVELKGEISEEQAERRLRTRTFLKEHGIYVPSFYPVIEAEKETVCRTPKEIAERTAGLAAVSLFSECLMGEGMSYEESHDFVSKWMEQFGAAGCLTPEEESYFLNPDSTEQERISFSWKYEALYVMEWALGLAGELDYPDHLCDVSQTIKVLKECATLDGLLSAAKPRSAAEMLDADDLIFCLDWACVDSRVYTLPAPAGMDEGVVVERHRALNWLVGAEDSVDWDHVGTDT